MNRRVIVLDGGTQSGRLWDYNGNPAGTWSLR